MLLPEMTSGTRRALLASLAWKEALGQTEVSPNHLLLGLIHEEEGTPSQLLHKQGVDRAAVMKQLQAEPRELPLAEELPIPLDSLLQKLLYEARHVALDRTGNPVVHSEHLLLALLESDDSLRDQLKSLGFEAGNVPGELSTSSALSIQLDEPLKLNDPYESASIGRILDANVNRGREALRVLEELARFHLNDAFLTRVAKELRHDLTQAFALHLPQHQLTNRDTLHDVGTEVSTQAEQNRSSLQAVLRANAQRLQESLRSLEEYGKVRSAEFGQTIEKIRYRSYTLEKALFIGDLARQKLAQARVYLLVSKSGCTASIDWTIREAAAGGVTMVQLREKHKSDRELYAIAREVRDVTRELGILFIMNDRPDIARLTEADGVHLGQSDLGVKAARSILGADTIVGISTHKRSDVERAILDGADYIGVGPTFTSQTKEFDDYPGVKYVKEVAEMTTLPAFAISGIDPNNVGKVVDAGLRRVAIGQAIAKAEEPRYVARQLHSALTNGKA